MPPLYEILFLFSAPQGQLAEVKRLDQPADAPPGRVYHWLWLGEAAITTLRFVAMATTPRQERTFEEARLWFDEAGGELQWLHGPAVALTALPHKTLSAAQASRVHQHLS